MSGQHFEEIAEAYRGARPTYPPALHDALVDDGVIGPGVRARHCPRP